MKPEMIVRKLSHRLGFRHRLHRKGLPGKPDLVFPSRKKVVFVHGCFWHQHPKAGCLDARLPRSNLAYWRPKLRRNVERDAEHLRKLRKAGWKALVIWECETSDPERLERRLSKFLGPAKKAT